jgi:molybdenum cofactor cytidylyltransferase
MTSSDQEPGGGVIVLAAGRSRRFGGDKRQHVLPDGRQLLAASLALYTAAFGRCILVLRPEDQATGIAPAPTPGVQYLYARDAELGMGHSLAAGASAAIGWRYLFVALADMAWTRRDTLARLRALMEQSAPQAIIQPVYRQTPGHPVGFGGAHREALTRLTGDQGARQVLEGCAHVRRIEVDDPGVLLDLDTPDHR